jgi:hypothetical protein
VRVLLATRQLVGPGGAETYLVTLAEGLRRLGHDVTFTATTVGEAGGGTRDAGFAAMPADEILDPAPNVIVVQDRALSLRLAQRHTGVPQIFVVHGIDHDYELPQPGTDVVAATVVLNERHRQRAEALDGAPPVVRLRQPIDMRHFRPHGEPSDRPRRALVLSNNFPPERLAALKRAWEPAGVEIAALGRNDALGLDGAVANDPRAQISAADVVVGYGRAMLEAMASRRAAFVFAGPGGDGWVTAEKYTAMEADGFAGGAFAETYDAARLTEALDEYDPGLGQVGRDLVRFPHDAAEHAAAVGALLQEAAGPCNTPPDRLRELERMVDLLWAAEGRAATLRVEVGALHDEVTRRVNHQAHLEQAIAERDAELERRDEQIARQERRHNEILSSRRYRLGRALSRPLEVLRQRD